MSESQSLATSKHKNVAKKKWKSTLQPHWLDFDLFSQPINLNVNGNTSHRSYPGLVLSVCFFMALVSITTIEMIKYIDRAEPTTTMDNRIVKVYERINLKDNGFIPAVLFYTNNDKTIEYDDLSKYYTVSWRKDIWTNKVGGRTDLLEYDASAEYFDVVRCGELPSNQTRYVEDDPTLTEPIKRHALCPVTNKSFSVSGRGSDKVYETLTLVIQPCSLPSGQCKVASEVDDTYFQVLYPSYALNFSDFDSPRTAFMQTEDYYNIDLQRTQNTYMKLRTNKILDYLGFSPKWVESDHYIDVGTTKQEVLSRNSQTECSKLTYKNTSECSPYAEIRFKSSPDIRLMYRRYKTTIETLGSIGGSLGTLFTIFGFIMGLILASKGDDFLANKVFPLIYSDNLEQITTDYENLLSKNSPNQEQELDCEPTPNVNTSLKYLEIADIRSKNPPKTKKDNFGTEPSDKIGENSPINLDSPNQGSNPAFDLLQKQTFITSHVNKFVLDPLANFPDFKKCNKELQLNYSLSDSFWQFRTMRCRCCRKKQATSNDEKKAIDNELALFAKRRALYECICENLDVVNLVKTMVEVKVIVKGIIEDRHRDLMHIVGFKEWLKDRKEDVESRNYLDKLYVESQRKKCCKGYGVCCTYYREAKLSDLECYIKYDRAKQCYREVAHSVSQENFDIPPHTRALDFYMYNNTFGVPRDNSKSQYKNNDDLDYRGLAPKETIGNLDLFSSLLQYRELHRHNTPHLHIANNHNSRNEEHQETDEFSDTLRHIRFPEGRLPNDN